MKAQQPAAKTLGSVIIKDVSCVSYCSEQEQRTKSVLITVNVIILSHHWTLCLCDSGLETLSLVVYYLQMTSSDQSNSIICATLLTCLRIHWITTPVVLCGVMSFIQYTRKMHYGMMMIMQNCNCYCWGREAIQPRIDSLPWSYWSKAGLPWPFGQNNDLRTCFLSAMLLCTGQSSI